MLETLPLSWEGVSLGSRGSHLKSFNGLPLGALTGPIEQVIRWRLER